MTDAAYREVQPYRELPPAVFLVVLSAAAGWALLIWVVFLGRPLGNAVLPTWLALVLGLGFGVVLPLLLWRLQMVTEVTPSVVSLQTGLGPRTLFPIDQITAVDVRVDDIRSDYSNRNVGVTENTRTAYVVNGHQGAQLTMRDGRLILIGSKTPEELAAAVEAARARLAPS